MTLLETFKFVLLMFSFNRFPTLKSCRDTKLPVLMNKDISLVTLRKLLLILHNITNPKLKIQS